MNALEPEPLGLVTAGDHYHMVRLEIFQIVAVGPGLSLPPRFQGGFDLQRLVVSDQKNVGAKKNSVLISDKEVADRLGVRADFFGRLII